MRPTGLLNAKRHTPDLRALGYETALRDSRWCPDVVMTVMQNAGMMMPPPCCTTLVRFATTVRFAPHPVIMNALRPMQCCSLPTGWPPLAMPACRLGVQGCMATAHGKFPWPPQTLTNHRSTRLLHELMKVRRTRTHTQKHINVTDSPQTNQCHARATNLLHNAEGL